MTAAAPTTAAQTAPTAVKLLKAPYPYFGGKSRVAAQVWARLGDVPNFVDPCYGSGAMLLQRPHPIPGLETVNDIDGLLANFWRALAADPDAVHHYADWPVSEVDLHARQWWLVNRRESITGKLEADPDFYDAQAAGWWVWGACIWIGSGWCSGDGPWQVVDGELVKVGRPGLRKKLPELSSGRGVHRKLPHLADNGRGINRQIPHLSDNGVGIHRQLPHLANDGRGINRQLPHLGDNGRGIHSTTHGRNLRGYLYDLAERMRRVRMSAGDWSRVVKPCVTTHHGLTGIFFDPPYGDGAMDYSVGGNGDKTVAHKIREWCIEHGDDPKLRIALCGYDDLNMPEGWTLLRWRQRKGYAMTQKARDNAGREVVWFSPHCLQVEE